ncbi:MAG: alpha-amylase family glycosyl hydrolase, partial [Chloroflexota bacterium]
MSPNNWMAGVHHDGSAAYVSKPLPQLNETVTLRLRVPLEAPVERVFIRTAPDGESHHEPMTISHKDASAVYWTGELKATMPHNTYRFWLITPDGGYHYNALAISRASMPDFYDFKLLADYVAPTWVSDAVFYQIFPDRFHNGDPSNDPQDDEWEYRGHAVRKRPWGELPLKWERGGSLDFYGGDLQGITEKLDYLEALGINALYLTPIFSSLSNHRYNIDDFFNVDKHLGGNESLIALREATAQRGIRLILDVTPNHSSNTHEWFKQAQQDPNATTASFYT